MDFLRRLVAVLGGVALLVAVAVSAGGALSSPRAEITPDYAHALQVIADLQKFPPTVPLVVHLGGSSARSSTVSDISWSRQVAASVGYRVDCYNLGSKERLLTQDRRIVGLLPDGVRPLVLIGVNMGRFCRAPYDPAVKLPSPSATPPTPQTQKLYTSTTPLSDTRKRQMVGEWMQQRWPAFQKNLKYELGVLEDAVKLSLQRGQHPVIIDLPRNMAIMGHQLDKPLDAYHAGCRAIANRNKIPYVQFQGKVGLKDSDFRDLWHLLPKSRMKWQRRLSITVATLVRRYDMRPSPSPSPSPSAPAAPGS